MSVLETVLVFVGIPLGVAVLLALLVFAGGAQRSPRYRPGQRLDFTPVWFLAAPPQDETPADRHALAAGTQGDLTRLPRAERVALSAGDGTAVPYGTVTPDLTTADGASAPDRPVTSGPGPDTTVVDRETRQKPRVGKGGARGTW